MSSPATIRALVLTGLGAFAVILALIPPLEPDVLAVGLSLLGLEQAARRTAA